jgi:hypothetical protein
MEASSHQSDTEPSSKKVNNKGAIREAIKMVIETLNGNPFKGTITQLEAE